MPVCIMLDTSIPMQSTDRKEGGGIQVTNMNGRYANVGETVIFPDERFNYRQDSMGNTLPKEPGTAGIVFVAVRQKDEDTCEAFSDSRGIERTTLSRPNLIAGRFALDG